MEDERKGLRHPIQPLGKDDQGVVRFKENKIVRILLDEGPFDLNQIAIWVAEGRVSTEDEIQLAQLIGYSHSGFGSLSYVDEETFQTALSMFECGRNELEARVGYLEDLVKRLKEKLREPMAELFECHPDDLMELDE